MYSYYLLSVSLAYLDFMSENILLSSLRGICRFFGRNMYTVT